MTLKELAAKHIEDAIRHGYFTLVDDSGEEIQRVVGTPTILSLCKLELKDTEPTKEVVSDNNTPSEMFNNPMLMDPLGQLELPKLSMYEAKLVEISDEGGSKKSSSPIDDNTFDSFKMSRTSNPPIADYFILNRKTE